MPWRVAIRMTRGHPGRCLLVVSLCGWMLQIAGAFGRGSLESVVALCSGGQVVLFDPGSVGHEHDARMLEWAAMVVGMAPLVLRNEIAFLWSGNLPRRRWSAIAMFACGYCLPWLGLGFFWTGLIAFERLGGGPVVLLAALVVAWHCSPTRQRLLNDCHLRPALRVFGAAMLADAGRFGLRSGSNCCALCGPAMMLAMMLPNHHLVAMAIVTLLVTIERYLPARRLVWRFPWPSRRQEFHWSGLTLPPPPGSSR